MNIGQAAMQSGLAAKTVRYYEEMRLVIPARCLGNDYRDYSVTDVEHLCFLKRARIAGFSVEVCRELLALYRDPERRCLQVKASVTEKIQSIEVQMHELNELQLTLSTMVNSCLYDDTANSAIEHAPAKAPASVMPFTLVEF